MKLLALLGAGLIATGAIAAAPASAQYHRGYGYGGHRGYGHGYGYRHAAGFRHGYAYRGHGGWGRHYARCRTFYRHGYRSRHCY